MDFRELQDHLRFLIKNASVGTSADISRWPDVVETIHRTAGTIGIKSMRAMCPLLLEALRTGSCGERRIVCMLMRVYFRFTANFKFHSPVQEEFYLRVICSEEERIALEKEAVLQAVEKGCCRHLDHSLFKNFYTLHREGWEVSAGETLSTDSIFNGCGDKWKILDVLIRYGFWNGTALSKHLGDFTLFWIHIQTILEKRKWCRIEKPWHRLFRNGGKTSIDKDRGFQRIRHILWPLRAVTVVEPQDLDAFLLCLKQYFAAVPDPLVSNEEVRDLLLYLLKKNSDRPFVDELVDRYEKVFGLQPYGPRRLKHLSRCAVRTRIIAMAENNPVTLPKLVETLIIPKGLKSFILGEPESDSFE